MKAVHIYSWQSVHFQTLYMSTFSLLDYQSRFLKGFIDKPLRNHRFSHHPHIVLQSNHRWLRNAGKCVDGFNESWTWTNVSPPSSRAKGVALKNVTVENISVVPTSHALCYARTICELSKCEGWRRACIEFCKWTHVCMDMNACALFGCDYGPVANLGVCHPRDDAYFSIRGSWYGNEGAFVSLACSCCMDDPNRGLWLGCSQSGRLHVMWPTWW